MTEEELEDYYGSTALMKAWWNGHIEAKDAEKTAHKKS